MDGFSKNTQIENFKANRPSVRADGRTDGQTDMTELTEAFCNFAIAPKEGKLSAIALTSNKRT
jgi:hypothetical protein